MATPKAATFSGVKPPKVKRGKQATPIAPEILETAAEGIKSPDPDLEWVSDNVQYKSRAAANAQATKVRKALAEGGEVTADGEDNVLSPYGFAQHSDIKSRVWPTSYDDDGKEVGPFYFGLAPREAE